ncbi:MAG TPA: cytochrome c [Thermoanaerobaculia bacterium]
MKGLRAVVGLVVLLALAAVAVVYSGVVDVAATHRLPGWVEKTLETAKDRSIDKRVAVSAAVPAFDDATVRDGLGHYQEMCVVCHGAPGVPAGEIGQGLNPPAPNLAEEAEEQSPQRLFWVVKNGILVSGMPAFGPTHTDAQVWQIVAFLKRLPKLDAASYAAMVKEAGGEAHEHESESPKPPTGTPATPQAKPAGPTGAA